MYDQKWDIFQIGIVLWSLFCDEEHPYLIDSATIRTIQDPKTNYMSRLSALWMMQTLNIGFPSAAEWNELQNFRVPNVQNNQPDEESRMKIMNQLKGIITKDPARRQKFEDAQYDSK